MDRTKLELCCDVMWFIISIVTLRKNGKGEKGRPRMGERYRMLSTNQNEALEDWNQRILECF